MRHFLWALLLFLTANRVHAALGDTSSEIVTHYGQPQGPPMHQTNKDVTLLFEYKDFVVSATFIEGQCQRETFTRKDKKAISDGDIEAILNSNTLGSKWDMMNENKEVKIWVLQTKAAFAGYYKEHPYLVVQTRGMLEFEEAVRQLQEKQRNQPAQPQQQTPPPAPPKDDVPRSMKP